GSSLDAAIATARHRGAAHACARCYVCRHGEDKSHGFSRRANTRARTVPWHLREWRQEYAPADVSAGRSATAFAVTLRMPGVATARIAERSLAARSVCTRSGQSKRLR